MRIILDDRRPFPDENRYNCYRRYEDCVEAIRIFRHVSFISLDYDLGGEKTGLDVLKYMAACGCEVGHINVHSDHSVGVPLMLEFANEHFPDARLTTNAL